MLKVIILAFLAGLLLAILLLIVWLLKKRGSLSARITTEKKSNFSDWSVEPYPTLTRPYARHTPLYRHTPRNEAAFEDAVNDITTEKKRGRLVGWIVGGGVAAVLGILGIPFSPSPYFPRPVPQPYVLEGPSLESEPHKKRSSLSASELYQKIITALTSPDATAIANATTGLVTLVEVLKYVMKHWKEEKHPSPNGSPPPGPPPPTNVIIVTPIIEEINFRMTDEAGSSSEEKVSYSDPDRLNYFIDLLGHSQTIKPVEATFRRGDDRKYTITAVPKMDEGTSPAPPVQLKAEQVLPVIEKMKLLEPRQTKG